MTNKNIFNICYQISLSTSQVASKHLFVLLKV